MLVYTPNEGDMMKKEDLIALKEKISKLSEEEKKQRDLYLRGISSGDIEGPMTGYASIDKPWLKYYSESKIVADIPTKTAFELIYDKRKDDEGLIAFTYLGVKITYKEFFEKVNIAAKALKILGVKKDDTVTLALPTSPETIYLFYALNKLGACANLIDPRLKQEDIENKILNTKSKIFIGLDDFLKELKDLKHNTGLKYIVSLTPFESLNKFMKFILTKGKKKSNDEFISWNEFVNIGNNCKEILAVPFEKDRPSAIVYTGGTTGEPKGVVLTNENLNTMAVTQELIEIEQSVGDSFLTFLPPFTAYGIVNAIHDPLYLGFKNTLVPKFEPKDFPVLIRKYKPNHVLSGPILWEQLMNDSKCDKMDFSFFKSPISGGDSMTKEQEQKINKFLSDRNCKYKITQGYGMTEVSAAAFYSKDSSYSLGSVGIPYIKNNVEIRNLDTKEEINYNEVGEVYISTPTLMKGYYNNPSETDSVIEKHADGTKWIGTGDTGYITPNGNLFLTGRLKRMIVRNGNKIFSANLENLIMETGLVENCSIVSMENEVERHVPVAYIVLKNEFIGYEKEIMDKINAVIADKMPNFYIPYLYVFNDFIPITGLNKIDFKAIEEFVSEYKDIDSDYVLRYGQMSNLNEKKVKM